ncbi:uncharacterized protein METZ01_LOCUS299132, partial [marine metagenome]
MQMQMKNRLSSRLTIVYHQTKSIIYTEHSS